MKTELRATIEEQALRVNYRIEYGTDAFMPLSGPTRSFQAMRQALDDAVASTSAHVQVCAVVTCNCDERCDHNCTCTVAQAHFDHDCSLYEPAHGEFAFAFHGTLGECLAFLRGIERGQARVTLSEANYHTASE